MRCPRCNEELSESEAVGLVRGYLAVQGAKGGKVRGIQKARPGYLMRAAANERWAKVREAKEGSVGKEEAKEEGEGSVGEGESAAKEGSVKGEGLSW